MQRNYLIIIGLILCITGLNNQLGFAKETILFGGGPFGGTFIVFANAVQSYEPIQSASEFEVQVESSAGSVENLRKTDAGTSDMSVVYSGHVYLGRNGLIKDDIKIYENVLPVAWLYGAPAQLVVKKDSGITNVTDLAGKKVGVGNAGSGAYANCELFFTHLGIWDKIEKSAIGYTDSAEAFGNNELDAFWLFTAYPSSAVILAAAANDIALVNIDADACSNGFYYTYPYFNRTFIPANTYQGVTYTTPTFQDSSLWVANANVSEDIVYEMLSLIYTDEGLSHIKAQKKTFQYMALGTGTNGIVTPFHPGAEKFWQEKGFTTDVSNGGVDPDCNVSDQNSSPNKPTLISPSNNASDISLTTSITTNVFSDPDPGDSHLQTDWEISTTSDFSSTILFESSTTNLTSLTVPHLTLQEGITYYWRVKFYDNNSNVSEWSDSYSFTTLQTQNDANDNGIPDSLENNTVDLNNDGIADIEQEIIKSLNTVVGNGQMGISINDASNVLSVKEIDSIDPDTISESSIPTEMPLALFSFRLQVANSGDKANVTVYFSEAAPSTAVWYVYDSINGWTDYSDHATFSQDRKSVNLELKDGDYGDADGVANGTIVDPCGFGIASWLKGQVTDASTNTAINEATIVIDDLNLSLDSLLDGMFISMILPGSYDIDVSAHGYQTKTISDIQIGEGSIVTQDVALEPSSSDSSNGGNNSSNSECRIKLQGISLSQSPVLNQPVTITAKAKETCSKPLYYRFSIHPHYGSDDYDGLQWQSMTTTEYTTNNSIQYTFDNEGKYIVVVWVTSDLSNLEVSGVPMMGLSVEAGNDEQKIDIQGFTLTGNQKRYRTVTLTTNASNKMGKSLHHRFSVHPGYGTSSYDGLQWKSMTDAEWVSDKTVDYAFSESGKYIVVVWVTDNITNLNPNGIPIIGWSVDIE